MLPKKTYKSHANPLSSSVSIPHSTSKAPPEPPLSTKIIQAHPSILIRTSPTEIPYIRSTTHTQQRPSLLSVPCLHHSTPIKRPGMIDCHFWPRPPLHPDHYLREDPQIPNLRLGSGMRQSRHGTLKKQETTRPVSYSNVCGI